MQTLQRVTCVLKTNYNYTLQIGTGVYKNNSDSGTTNRDRFPRKHLRFRNYKQGPVPTKTTLIQRLQITTGFYKNNSDSDSINRQVSTKTTPIQTLQIVTGVLKTNYNYTLQIGTGVNKNYSDSETTNRNRCLRKHL